MGHREFPGANRDEERQEQQQKNEEQQCGGGWGTGQQETAVLRLAYTNAQSIFSKLDELAAYAAVNKPDIILLTETWCNAATTDANLSIPNYQLETELRKDRSDTANGIGGGLLVYSKIGLKILPGDNLESKFHQYVTFKVLTKTEAVSIVLAYRPPNSGKENVETLSKLLKTAKE